MSIPKEEILEFNTECRIADAELYGSYEKWCSRHDVKSCSFTQFMNILKTVALKGD